MTELIDEGIKLQKEVDRRERQQQLGGAVRSGNSNSYRSRSRESQQQNGLDLPIPRAQRDAQRRRESISMIVTLHEDQEMKTVR